MLQTIMFRGDFNMEEWRDIDGYAGYYQVSNKGRVRSLDRVVKTSEKFGGKKKIKGKILACSKVEGYPAVALCKDGDEYKEFVHRLVARAFIPNPDNKPEVNHIDADRSNDNVENLEWVTHLENIQHSERLGLRTVNTKKAIDASKKKIIRSDGKVFESIADAGRALGYSSGREVTKVLSGNRKHINGYTFKYFDNDIDNAEWLESQKNNCFVKLPHNAKRVLRSDGKIFESAAAAGRDLGFVNGDHVSQVCNGIRNHAGGYRFEYID